MSKIEETMENNWLEFINSDHFKTYLSNAEYKLDSAFWVWYAENKKEAAL